MSNLNSHADGSNHERTYMEPTHTGSTTVPADYRDPNHPHNGDIEGHLGAPAPNPFPKKRIILAVVLGLGFLGALGATTGTGFWYGKTHTKKPLPSPEAPNIVTAIEATTTRLQTKSIKTLTYVTAPNKPTKTTTITGIPTSDACLISNFFPSRDECENSCKGIPRRDETRCEAQRNSWGCLQCVFPDDGTCRIGTTYGSLSECGIHCLGVADEETPHCVSTANNQFWNCFKCPVKKEEAVPFQTQIRATANLPPDDEHPQAPATKATRS